MHSLNVSSFLLFLFSEITVNAGFCQLVDILNETCQFQNLFDHASSLMLYDLISLAVPIFEKVHL